MHKVISTCPVCSSELTVTRLFCYNCNTTIEGQFLTESNPFAALNKEQLQFLLTFVRCEGRFNRMEDEMRMSYPTLRSRLNEIIRALGFEPGKEEPVIRLTQDDRRQILEDLDTGQISWAEAQRRLRGEPPEENAPVKNPEEGGA